jgi:galactose mutarotase-like enzyme
VARVHRFEDEAALTLATGELSATFLPDLGMLGVSLRLGDHELLAIPDGLDRYRRGRVTGLPLLAPWANRLGRLHYEVAGTTVELGGLDLADDGQGLPIHGTMTAQPGWEVVAVEEPPTASRLRARFDYGARPDLLAAFPFPHHLELDATVDASTLHVATVLRPTGERRVPVSFGWHPYFALPDEPREAWRLRLPECRHLVLDDHGLPTGESVTQPEGVEALAERSYDDAYALEDDRVLWAEGGGLRITVRFEEHYPFAQVYGPADEPFVCIEPMTAPTNALVSGQCPVVDPGDVFAARFSVTPERLG